MLHNTVSHCGGTKGPVVIDIDLSLGLTPTPDVFVFSNSFDNNSGIFSGGALALFSYIGGYSLFE